MCSLTSSLVGPPPIIIKEAAQDNGGVPGVYGNSVDATIGDTLWFRVRMNTNDGANPITSNVQFGNIDVVDWIPRGTQYVNGSSTMNFSDAGDFHYDPPPGKFSARYNDQPEQVWSGALDGVAWSLGNVDMGGWWEVEFRVVVQDQPVVADGVVVADFGKLSGDNSHAIQYSERDIADINYIEPNLTIDKSVVSTPTPFGAGSPVDYSITLANNGTATAYDVEVVDTLHPGMRDTDPSGTVVVTPINPPGPPLTPGTDYSVSWNGSQLTVDFAG